MWTIGHSNRPLTEFLAMLRAHTVKMLVDVRSVPKSRHNPQFNRDTLPEPLAEAGIGYIHLAALGGLRHPANDSRNTAWKNLSFRGYADYMQTPEFARGIEELLRIDSLSPAAIMCAEAVPWRCHRSLIADALTARGIPVWHILGEHREEPHRVTSFALVEGSRVTYPGENLDLFR